MKKPPAKNKEPEVDFVLSIDPLMIPLATSLLITKNESLSMDERIIAIPLKNLLILR